MSSSRTTITLGVPVAGRTGSGHQGVDSLVVRPMIGPSVVG